MPVPHFAQQPSLRQYRTRRRRVRRGTRADRRPLACPCPRPIFSRAGFSAGSGRSCGTKSARACVIIVWEKKRPEKAEFKGQGLRMIMVSGFGFRGFGVQD
eukprot:2607846-Rhodomonas_salina.2